MSDEKTSSHEEQLDDLLDQWEEATERGEEPDPVELCANSPELLSDLVRRIDALKAVDRKLSRDTTQIRPASSQDNAIGDHHLTQTSYGELQFLAQGGLGVVYCGVDEQLHRDVVLKFIHRKMARNEEVRRTFRREAEITSRLDHPGIVPVYGIGESNDGRVFYVMRYVKGQTLDEEIDRYHTDRSSVGDSLALRKLLSRFIAICKTIAYAHSRGIIHRDIKPANIMLGRYGETLMVDWGLASPVGRDERHKQEGERTLLPTDLDNNSDSGAGTPAYMSPEAVDNAVLTPATDIYSLGATLYKLLTNRIAFEANSLAEFRSQVRRGDFESPRIRNSAVPKPLDAICMKAMATNPNERYSTAKELAADVERYLADEAVTAYTEPRLGQLARWARRHRSLAQALLLAGTALAIVIAIATVWLGYMARKEHAARVSAEAADEQSLRMTAKFAARTVAGQIDLRCRVLEFASKSASREPTVIDSLQVKGDRAHWKPAQDWLNQQYIQLENDYAIEFSSLFLLDAEGTQIARAPIGDSIGKSYAFRDYFHGQGHDLDPETMSAIEPISSVNLSATYSSSTSKKLKVAFTVPLHAEDDGERRVAGVLGMSVNLGNFGVLKTDVGSDHIVVLVDTREDTVEGPTRRGLVLQHPHLDQAGGADIRRISADSLNTIAGKLGALWLEDYVDPFIDGQWQTTFERVAIDGRKGRSAETGWVVLVQEERGEK